MLIVFYLMAATFVYGVFLTHRNTLVRSGTGHNGNSISDRQVIT